MFSDNRQFTLICCCRKGEVGKLRENICETNKRGFTKRASRKYWDAPSLSGSREGWHRTIFSHIYTDNDSTRRDVKVVGTESAAPVLVRNWTGAGGYYVAKYGLARRFGKPDRGAAISAKCDCRVKTNRAKRMTQIDWRGYECRNFTTSRGCFANRRPIFEYTLITQPAGRPVREKHFHCGARVKSGKCVGRVDTGHGRQVGAHERGGL